MVDPRLISYVRQMRQQGYSDEQIHSGLIQQNYPESLVKAAFASATEPTIADSNIMRNYIQTYLQQGYTQEQVSQGLLQQGFAEKDVSRSMREATGGSQERPKLPVGMFFFSFLALLIIGGGVFLLTTIDFSSEPVIDAPPPSTGTRLSDIIDNLIPLASENPTAAVALCNKVIDVDKGHCFKTVSTESNNPAVCKDISETDLRDRCYLKFIYEGHLDYCERLELAENIEFCDAVKNLDLETTDA